jgi:predicted house-cleaning noncanonical NTP pyrophosphatase (MazG superfamily)
MQKQTVTKGTHVTQQEDSQETVESSVLEEVEEFLDEVDKLLEDQDVLVKFRQRGGE